MSDEAQVWIRYAEENYQSARVLLGCQLLNPCLHNVQQAVEKWLKALLLRASVVLKKTHSIAELRGLCADAGYQLDLSDDDVEFLDAIYLPSKYPLGSALPAFYPDQAVCQKALLIAERVQSCIASL